jgi:hypothetical protein
MCACVRACVRVRGCVCAGVRGWVRATHECVQRVLPREGRARRGGRGAGGGPAMLASRKDHDMNFRIWSRMLEGSILKSTRVTVLILYMKPPHMSR